MSKAILFFFLFLSAQAAFAGDRFGRSVIKLKEEKDYQLVKRDDVQYPSLSNDHLVVECLVYRGRDRYYVEISVLNKSAAPLDIPINFINFEKPEYTVYRSDSLLAARELAMSGGVSFTPTPAPYVPPTYHTTVNTASTTYGNQTYSSGTATTTTDTSGQAGANFGNALGNAIAANRFRKAQREDVALSRFLASHFQTPVDTALAPGQSRTIAATFEQAKMKKKDFVVTITLGAESFHFAYKE